MGENRQQSREAVETMRPQRGRIADNPERKGRGYKELETTEAGRSPTIQRGKAGSIQNKRPQRERIVDERKGIGYT